MIGIMDVDDFVEDSKIPFDEDVCVPSKAKKKVHFDVNACVP